MKNIPENLDSDIYEPHPDDREDVALAKRLIRKLKAQERETPHKKKGGQNMAIPILFGALLFIAFLMIAAPEIVAIKAMSDGCEVTPEGGVPGWSTSYDIECSP